MISKSLFSNGTNINYFRHIYNPVYTGGTTDGGGGLGGGGGGGGFIGGSNDLTLITEDNLVSFRNIGALYSSNMANKRYEQIPHDYNLYVELYVMVEKVKQKIKNQKLLTLVQIVEDALVGSINSYALYGYNISLNLDKVGLKKTIDDILSGKNEKVVEMAQASGQLNITKSFKLAPVFNYYIIIYGMPAYGAGFDPVKINFLVDILKSKGINPYK
jgi:hypothetical protein